MLKKFCLIFFILIVVCMPFVFRKKQTSENTVVFWTLQLNTFEPYMRKVISEFEKENQGIKIRWIDVPYSEGEKRVLASLLSNSMPDIVNITADFTKTLSDKNALFLISKEQTADYNDQIMNTLKKGDEYMAFPFYATSAVTFYNKGIVEKSGISKIPVTFGELDKITPVIKKKTGNFAQMPTICENDTFLKILNKYNIRNYKEFNSPETIAIYDKYKDFYKNNFIPKESIIQTHREVLEKYGAGQIAFLQAGANFLNIIEENSPNVYAQTDVSAQLKTKNSGYDFSLMTLAIPKKAKNKETAEKFIKFLLNDKNQLEFAKLTSILPVNKTALQNEYFTNTKTNDIKAKARSISANQLNNLQKPICLEKNQREIINLINTTTQSILLDKVQIEQAVKETAKNWELFEKN